MKMILIARLYLPILKKIDELNKAAGHHDCMRVLCLFRHEVMITIEKIQD